ncbi:hypothetical protein BN946_scf184871.g9 [Trametes cinnabarina]|uniref:Uncharacterized protein n=1 Tax=Pycnoporus cinnabarinus TaxID=5643 RepID=A0A060SSU2_PYCCI|nr:hypothetical protein BN946_scf184871.g9 [Trametes cinnabarina]
MSFFGETYERPSAHHRESTLHLLTEDGQKITQLGPTLPAASEKIISIGAQVDDHDAKRDARVHDLQKKIQRDHKQRALEAMKEHFKGQTRAEIKRQVKGEMDGQMYPAHLPKPLKDQVAEGAAQVVALKAALHNSQARRANATITDKDMSLPLTPIQRPDGSISAVFPAHLNALLAYDEARTQQVLADYGLADPRLTDHVLNVNRFMAYIGVVGVSLMTPILGGSSVLASSGR